MELKNKLSKNQNELKLDRLLELHYNQQPLDGIYNVNLAKSFNLKFAKLAYQLCKEVKKYDTLQALAIDIGYIYSIREEYDSAFTYYVNTINIFEEIGRYDNTFSLTQNILYNNTTLYKIIEADRVDQRKKSNEILLLLTVLLVLFLVIIFSTVLFYKKLKLKNKQIAIKNLTLEDAQYQIKSSLDYAQNIQNSILQNEIGLTKSFNDSFVFFKPKDKVSGDFLWTNIYEQDFFIAVADCTGHGVPGALISLVGNFLLDAIVNYHKLLCTNKILDRLHIEIVKTLNKNAYNKKLIDDGMDIALIKVNKEKKMLQFSGANRSVYIIRSNELIELKGNRRPIGETVVDYDSFRSIEFQLQDKDVIYAFSDGYYDQFNESGKKFYRKNFLKLLVDYSNLSLEEQKEKIIGAFIAHQGESAQTDDILVVGLKI